MHAFRRLFQMAFTVVIVTTLFSVVPFAPASAVASGPMAWLWRQPPYDPSHPYPPRPAAQVVAWGGVDKNVIYVATYPSSSTGIPHGLYRSKDQGNTWEYLGKVDANEYITHLISHPTNPEILLAGFHRGGIYRSVDGGETWTNVLPGLGTYDIEIAPSHPNIIFAEVTAIVSPGIYCGIYKSTDQGQTWQCLSTSFWMSDIVIHPTSSNILFGVYLQGVYRSRDAGATWQRISQTPVQATRILINQNKPSQMFIFGYPYTGIWRTEDGGRSWSNTTSNLPRVIADPTILTAVLDPGDPNTIWVGLKYDGMYVSHDSGDTWEHASIGIYYLGAGIYGPHCTSSDIASGRLVVACTGRSYIQVPRESLAIVGVAIEGKYRGSVFFPVGESTRVTYSFNHLNNGPVQMVGDQNFIAAERVISQVNGVATSFTEMMALPNNQLATTFWLPWYNNKDLDTQLHFANVSNATAAVHIFIGGVEMGSGFTLMPGQSTRHSFAGINNGPVKIISDQNMVAAQQVLYKVNRVHTSVSETMALSDTQLDTMYWLPWYNNVDLDTQLRFANVSDQPASVHVYIGGVEMTGSPFYLLAGQSTRRSFPGVNTGPVKIVSDQPIVAAERVIYKVNGVNTSFSEMMALPNSRVDTTYWVPWYNNVDLNTQLRFANVNDTPATVHIYSGRVEMQGSPFTLDANQSTRISFPGINTGPVQIVSDIPIVAAERVIYKVNGINTSFSEMMGLPDSQLDTIYWLPWYNDMDFDTQLRFGSP